MSMPSSEDFRFRLQVPEGDTRERLVCDSCGWIHYVNPKIVVGAVCIWQDQVLLCRRAIEPRRGYWTIPAGYLEEEETTEAGAIREVKEEAGADIALSGLLAIYSIPRISQVQLIYKAELLSPEIAAGEESLEVGLYEWARIPWPELAFPTVRWALHHHREVGKATSFSPRTNPIEAQPPTL